MKNLYRILTFVACIGIFGQCADDGEYDHPINQDSIPEVPVLFTGATSFGGNPYYQIKFEGTGTAISINIAVPGDATVKIKEITKVVAGTTSITPGNVTTASVANFLPAAVAVNGASTTITTSVTALNAYISGTANDATQARVDAATTATPATPYIEYAFLFLVTLEDNTTIITQQCRLRFVK
ncbi:MAG TPA: hypothetical protein VK508_19035 [Cyclobacteriaceae bacterium]|nr:hypothetical protein [Cyclobacteriaceae bacterium]